PGDPGRGRRDASHAARGDAGRRRRDPSYAARGDPGRRRRDPSRASRGDPGRRRGDPSYAAGGDPGRRRRDPSRAPRRYANAGRAVEGSCAGIARRSQDAHASPARGLHRQGETSGRGVAGEGAAENAAQTPLTYTRRVRTARLVLIYIASLAIYIASLAGPAVIAANGIPTPESVFGFRPGADYKLATYEQSVEYFKKLDAASKYVRLVEAGTRSQG